MNTTLTPHLGTTTYKLSRRSLLASCAFSLAALTLHIIRPGNLFYAALLLALCAVNIIAIRVCRWAPNIALQGYWWAALIVISAMTFVDARSGASAFPLVVAIPPVATLCIRLLVSLRAAAFYGLGAIALVIPTGVVYGDIGQAGALIGVVILAVMIRGGVNRENNESEQTRAALIECRDRLQQINDAIADRE